MARAGRFLFRLLLAGALSAGAYAAWVSTLGSPAPISVLPPGASVVLEVRDAAGLVRQLSGTRFAAAFARSATGELLERSAAVTAFDAALAEVGRFSGVSLGRSSALDLVGAEAAVGWYPPDGAGSVPWVAAGRLSLRAWLLAHALRLGRRFDIGASSVSREEVSGQVVYSLSENAGEPLHLFLVGRVLVGSPERSLAQLAVRAVDGTGDSVSREPAFLGIRGALPSDGEVFAWARGLNAIPGAPPTGGARHGSVGARLRSGRTTTIDIASEPAVPRPAVAQAEGAATTLLPGIALLRRDPLVLFSSREAVPGEATEWLRTRQRAVSRRGAGRSATALQPARGYAVVVTGGAGGSGLFPVPQGLAVIGMANAAEAASALAQLFPPGSRTAIVGGTRALATSESFPLAGQFELWGAAIGPLLVFATDTSLLDASRADAGIGGASGTEHPPWPVVAVAAVSVEKALPLLRRWRAPLSGLVVANWPDAPDVTRDLGLLAAVGTVRADIGSEGRFDRALITLDVHDLR